MEFGKLENVDDVDWTLPNADPLSVSFLSGQSGPRSLDISFGAPAWAHREWVGSIYPLKTVSTKYLYFYSRYFSCIELNTSHYRIPSLDQTQKWKSLVPPNFRFCAKIFKGISHERNGLLNQALIQDWRHFLDQLGDHRGPCFLQLPPYFDYSYKRELFSFLQNWPPQYELAIELRHPSWFKHGHVISPLTQYLQERGIGLVITDVGGRRDVLHSSISASFCLVRFIGNNLHVSDFERAKTWTKKFLEWQDQGLKNLYLFIHEPDDIQTPQMSDFFLTQLEEIGGWKVKPAFLAQPQTQIQLSL